ncbi:LemA family protein [Candidatus Shapirobacteria bacterium]|nr:LemA family protein [Candidatus Shapirobacteria bacterium]
MNFFGFYLNITLLLWILAGLIAFVLLFLWNRYNSFVSGRNRVKADFADIDVQLRRRASLIDNLAEIVREYAKHEKTTFSDVAEARAALEKPHSPKDSAVADNMLTSTLRSLFAVSEDYPDLLASTNYQQLRADIKETENLIANYREKYNQTVLGFNTMIDTFPNLLAANLFGFKDEELFETDVAGKQEVSLAAA